MNKYNCRMRGRKLRFDGKERFSKPERGGFCDKEIVRFVTWDLYGQYVFIAFMSVCNKS